MEGGQRTRRSEREDEKVKKMNSEGGGKEREKD